MTRIAAKSTATLAQLGDPRAVLEGAGGEPVAILDEGKVVAYLVPAERTAAGHRVATREEVMEHLSESRERVQPVLDYLRDK